ncbi:hypothetical protein RB195_002403 [Necator americanus]|uniref:DDE Tnp4 domain-containing protein n=2 Tax=Necator americanus TaxID=51031 RepID=A0ABR1DKB4_NECAM
MRAKRISKGSSTIDHIHSVSKVSREYKMPPCLTFINLKKAFDSVETEAVMEVLDNRGVPIQYIKREVGHGDPTSPRIFAASRKLEWNDMMGIVCLIHAQRNEHIRVHQLRLSVSGNKHEERPDPRAGQEETSDLERKSIEDVMKKNILLRAHLLNTALSALTYAPETWALRNQEENALTTGIPEGRSTGRLWHGKMEELLALSRPVRRSTGIKGAASSFYFSVCFHERMERFATFEMRRETILEFSGIVATVMLFCARSFRPVLLPHTVRPSTTPVVEEKRRHGIHHQPKPELAGLKDDECRKKFHQRKRKREGDADSFTKCIGCCKGNASGVTRTTGDFCPQKRLRKKSLPEWRFKWEDKKRNIMYNFAINDIIRNTVDHCSADVVLTRNAILKHVVNLKLAAACGPINQMLGRDPQGEFQKYFDTRVGDSMAVVNNPREVVAMLDCIDSMVDVLEYLHESGRKRRTYVRPEHVPFLETRFRDFDEYLSSQTPESFLQYTRLYPEEFEQLFEHLGGRLHHASTHAAPIGARQRLCIYLRFVGNGFNFTNLSEEFSCGKATVSAIVSEVMEAIIESETHNAFPPITRQYLEKVAEKTQELYDYPRAVGFLDGRHVAIKKPNGGIEEYLNYKNFQSIVLLAICDADYRFLLFDVGLPGNLGDASVFRSSSIFTFFNECDDLFPETADLGSVGPVQYHILTDDGLGQGVRYIEPFPGRSADTGSKQRFNKKHGCARRVIDIAFEMLQRRFAVLQKPLQLEPNRGGRLVTSLLILHNLVAYKQDVAAYVERYPAPTETLVGLQPIPQARGPERARLARERIVQHYDNLYGVLM